ncbi:MAG TPA: VWA domain-containing protein [Gammaproteobacteria bacterium]|nr:VWA domain-containing protein [Gammaproteobacteria bacterium]
MTRWRRPAVLLLVLACVALAATFVRPTLRMTTPAYRYVFVFDITESMNAEDVLLAGKSASRLDYAKRQALEALKDLPCGTEAGLALFAGHRAFLLITPIEICANYREISAVLANISWRMSWEPRSEVAKGLYKSIGLMKQLPAQTRLVFVSDGDEAPPIDPAVTPQFTGEPGEIRGLLVGVGGDVPAPIPKFDDEGVRIGEWSARDFENRGSDLPPHMAQAGVLNAHLSALQEPYLQTLAAQTGLGYLRLTDAGALARRLQGAELGIPSTRQVDVRGWFAGAALAVFLLTLIAGRNRRRGA